MSVTSNLPLKLGLVDTKSQLTSPVPDRASDVYVINPDGVMIQYRGNGENLVEDSDDLTAGSWIETGSGTVNSATLFTFAAQNDVLDTDITTEEGKSYIYSFKAQWISGNTSLKTYHNGSATGNTTALTVTGTLTRYSVVVLGKAGGGTVEFGIQDVNAGSFGQVLYTDIQVEETSVPINELEDETAFTAANYRISLHANASYFTGDDGAGADIQNFAGTAYLLKVTIGGVSAYGYIGAAEGGEALEAEEATGTATLNKFYKITASEVNHFYTSSVIGDYFVSDGAETLDANNKVQEVSSSDVTGVTIYTTQALSTEGWAIIEDGFTVQPANGAAITFEIYDNKLGDTEPRVYAPTSGGTAVIPAEAAFNDKGVVNIGPVTNWLLQSNGFDQVIWTTSGTPGITQNETDIAGNANTAWTLEDDDAGTMEVIEQTFAKSTSDTDIWTLSVYIKKDAITSRFPDFGFYFFNENAKNYGVSINTSTGVTAERTTTASNMSNSVEDLGTWWKVNVHASDNGSNSSVKVYLYPARGETIGGSDVSAVGSIIICHAMLTRTPYALPFHIPTTTVLVTTTSQVVPWTMSTVFKGILSDAVNGSTSEGTLIASWTPYYDEADGSGDAAIISISDSIYSILYTLHDTGVTVTYDGTNVTNSALSFVANTTYTLIIRWSKRQNKLQVSVIDAGVLTNGTATSYDGAFALGTDLIIGYGNNYPFSLAKLMVFNSWLLDAEVSDYPNNIGMSVRRHILQGR